MILRISCAKTVQKKSNRVWAYGESNCRDGGTDLCFWDSVGFGVRLMTLYMVLVYRLDNNVIINYELAHSCNGRLIVI